MSKRTTKLTHEEFCDRLHSKFPDIAPITQYINQATEITLKCHKCNSEWNTTPSKIFDKRNKYGCKKCAKGIRAEYTSKRLTMSCDDMLIKLHNSRKDVSYVKGYIKMSTECTWQCKICNSTWEARPSSILNDGTGCKKCQDNSLITPIEDIRKLINDLYNNSISYVDGYIDKSKNCTWKCSICGHIWNNTPNNIIKFGSCPSCSMSGGERKIKSLLDTNNVNYKQQYTFKNLKGVNGGTLKFDFAIFDNNWNLLNLVEFDGRQHDKPCKFYGGEKTFLILKQNDTLKNIYCEKNNIPLIRIKDRRKFDINSLIVGEI